MNEELSKLDSKNLLKEGTMLNHGKYRIFRHLASGGFGNTYEALNVAFEKTCAIKEFFMKGVSLRNESTNEISIAHPENKRLFNGQKDKFKKEARRINTLNNEHIVKVYDLFEENGTVYYVMEYIDGKSLYQLQKGLHHPFSEKQALVIFVQLLDALKVIHENSILHMDLKPANVLIDKNGKCTVIDFGASKQSTIDSGTTTSSALAYTLGYAPNEQINGKSENWGPWTDFYALGATMYNLLTGISPSTLDIEEDGEDAFEFPSNISENIQNLIIWLMSPRRKDRPQSVDDIDSYLKENKVTVENEQSVLDSFYPKEILIDKKSEFSEEKSAGDNRNNKEDTYFEQENSYLQRNNTLLENMKGDFNKFPDKEPHSNKVKSKEAKKNKNALRNTLIIALITCGLVMGVYYIFHREEESPITPLQKNEKPKKENELNHINTEVSQKPNVQQVKPEEQKPAIQRQNLNKKDTSKNSIITEKKENKKNEKIPYSKDMKIKENITIQQKSQNGRELDQEGIQNPNTKDMTKEKNNIKQTNKNEEIERQKKQEEMEREFKAAEMEDYFE